MKMFTYTLHYHINITYIVYRHWGGPVITYSSLLLTADEAAQPLASTKGINSQYQLHYKV
jgi:hypothetical protein